MGLRVWFVDMMGCGGYIMFCYEAIVIVYFFGRGWSVHGELRAEARAAGGAGYRGYKG